MSLHTNMVATWVTIWKVGVAEVWLEGTEGEGR
jgi:hypothetical protein